MLKLLTLSFGLFVLDGSLDGVGAQTNVAFRSCTFEFGDLEIMYESFRVIWRFRGDIVDGFMVIVVFNNAVSSPSFKESDFVYVEFAMSSSLFTEYVSLRLLFLLGYASACLCKDIKGVLCFNVSVLKPPVA